MRVQNRMSRELVTVTKDTNVRRAIELMRMHSIRHLPVIEEDRFVGFVTESDLRGAYVASLVEEITVGDIMISDPVTVSPGDTVEHAAMLLYHKKIGGLPVLEDGRLVGIITVADVLEAFIEFLGMLESSSRMDVVLKPSPTSFQTVSRLISEAGGHVISVGVSYQEGAGKVHSFRLHKMNLSPLVDCLNQEGHRVIGYEE